MAAAGRSAAEGRQLRLAFFLPLVATPTEISACKPNEKLIRHLGSSSLHVLRQPLSLARTCDNVEHVHVQERPSYVIQQHSTGWPNVFINCNSTM